MGSIDKGQTFKQDISLWNGVAQTDTRDTSEDYTLTLNKIDWPGVDVMHVYGGGVNRTKAALTAALTAVGAVNKMRFFLSPGEWAITDDLTITDNITLYVPPGASLAVTAAKTLTIEGPIEAGPYQIFSGAGTITISSVILEHDKWRDGVGDDILPSTDNSIDLGSATQEFKDIYIDGKAYLDAIDLNGTDITSTATELNQTDGVGLLVGDTTLGRVVRTAVLWIDNATAANEIKCTLTDRWNGDAIATTDNIGKGETVGNFTLNAAGTYLKVENAGLYGTVIAIIASNIQENHSGTALTCDCYTSGSDIALRLPHATNGTDQDMATLVDTGYIYVVITYLTDA